mgnify:CR=1 FL=1
MGDIADSILDQMFDPAFDDQLEEGEDYYYDPSNHNPIRFSSQQTKTCRYCKKTGLHWEETENGWRLADETGLHTCPQYKPRK